MIVLILKRLTWSLFVITIVLTFVFTLLFGIGDPAVAQLGPKAHPSQLRAFRKQYGLDQPISKQLTAYIGITPCLRKTESVSKAKFCGLLQGDFGESMSHQESVTEVILKRLPRTLLLSVMAMGFELLIGLGLGLIAAVQRDSWLDTGLMASTFVGMSAPTFLTGILFLQWAAFRLGWFPVGGYGIDTWDHIRHALLPAFTLAIIGASTYARMFRSELIETLRAEFVRTARAKGAGPWRVLFAHGVRTAMLPIVTLAGLHLASLVSGAVITESIYAWPGMGLLAVQSVTNLDLFAVMAIVLLSSAMVQLGNFLADVAVALLDPRIRVEP